MIYPIKKTGRIFDSRRSVINHIRKIYNSIEIAYLSEHDVVAPECKYCTDTAKFLSFFEGYSNVCSNKICKYENLKCSNRISGKLRVEAKETISANEILKNRRIIIDNIEYYKQNQLSKNVYDCITDTYTDNRSLYSYLRSKFSLNIFTIERNCIFCDKSFTLNIIKDELSKNYCKSKNCYNLKNNGYATADQIFKTSRELNNFVHENDIKLDEIKQYAQNFNVYKNIFKPMSTPSYLHKCPITHWIIPIVGKTNRLVNFLNDNAIDINLYFEQHFPNRVKYCLNCNEINYVDINNIGTKIESIKFCNRSCYKQYKCNNPEIYELSIFSRNKQSETLKRKIANGEFTPCVTNSWTHWDATITLDIGLIKKFRSSWDACFWICNMELEYETIRIPYEFENKQHNYIVDFYDPMNKIIYEIKPDSVKDQPRNVIKRQTAQIYAKDNNLEYIMITNEWFVKNVYKVDFEKFPNMKQPMRQFLDK